MNNCQRGQAHRIRKLITILTACHVYHLLIFSFSAKRRSDITTPNEIQNNTKLGQPNISIPSSLPLIYVITPTASVLTQKAHLTRLSQTLSLVPSLFWIVVEDSMIATSLVSRILEKSHIPHVHLWTRVEYNQSHYKGCAQRNFALKWLRQTHAKRFKNFNFSPPQQFVEKTINFTDNSFAPQFPDTDVKGQKIPNALTLQSLADTSDIGGVVYFADDDNTYDLEVFQEMRKIKKVGVWPVAFCGGLYMERPKVKNGKVIGWVVSYEPNRPMATDMAGFAINLDLIIEKNDAYFKEVPNPDGLESGFVHQFAELEDLEPLADNCTKVIVWHTRTANPVLVLEDSFIKQHNVSSRDGFEV